MAKKPSGHRANKNNDSFGTINNENLYRNAYRKDVYKDDEEEVENEEQQAQSDPTEEVATQEDNTSGDSFVEDSSNHHGEVVDMEAYALAKVCYLYDVPFISFKYITDGADGNAVVDWEENVGKGIVKFKEKVLDKLENNS